METWEEAGLTREEYDEAMREMAEVFGDHELTDADMMNMHVTHVLDDVIPDGETNGYTVESWSEVCSAIEECDILQIEYASEMDKHAVQRMADFVHDKGYDPKAFGVGSVHAWADNIGKDIARRDGVSWSDVKSDSLLDVRDGGAYDQSFDKMLDYCVENHVQWTPSMGRMMNEKIIQEFHGIEQAAYEGAMQEEMMHAEADNIDFERERDGIQGDEPDIPWFEARDHAFGKSADTLHAEASDFGEEVGRTYESDMKDLYERVYRTDSVDFQSIPDYVRGNAKEHDFKVARTTYDELGDGYTAFYTRKLNEYSTERVNAFSGIDLSKSAQASADMVVPHAERKVERKVEKTDATRQSGRKLPKNAPQSSGFENNGLDDYGDN